MADGVPVRPWANTMSGKSPSTDDVGVGEEDGGLEGALGSAGVWAPAGVGRDGSTSVSWVTETP